MSDEARPLVSVIVPIYNTQEFLPRCLDSILNQSYVNMEMILVNDGSTDDSVSVCESYAEKDVRVQVISQSNQGIIAAKKAGIRICQGTYVMFVDSDDWIEPELMETMVQKMQESDCSLVCADVYLDFESGEYTEYRNAVSPGIYDTDKIAKDLFYYKDTNAYGVLPYSVAKLYPRDMLTKVLNHISSDIRYAEDKAIVFSFVFQDIKVCFTDAVHYHYCTRSGRASRSENQNYLVELTAFYKYAKKLFDSHKEREHLLWQLGRYLLQEEIYAVNDKLGLTTPDKPIYTVPYQLDASAFFSEKKKVILYGAGKVGADYYKQITDCMNMELCGWVDKNYGKYQAEELDVQPIEYIQKTEYDYILIAVRKQTVFEEIKKELSAMGISEDAVIWGRPYGAPYQDSQPRLPVSGIDR